VLALLPLPACCCRGGGAPGAAPEKIAPSLIGTRDIPTPSQAIAKAPVEAEMHNGWVHIDRDADLHIHPLRGRMLPNQPGALLNFDDKSTFVMTVDTGRIGMSSASLDVLMNRYVFNDRNSPLRNLHVAPEGKQLRQQGIVHKIIDIPFTMW